MLHRDRQSIFSVFSSHPCPLHHRPRPAVENNAYAAFARRILAAYARRIATGDIESLTELTHLANDIDAAMQEAITCLRAFGYSWADIGSRLGVTRQAAQQRWGTHT